jgi:hypothetical protein
MTEKPDGSLGRVDPLEHGRARTRQSATSRASHVSIGTSLRLSTTMAVCVRDTRERIATAAKAFGCRPNKLA